MIIIMFPIFGRYGSLFVYAYTVIMALGVLVGIYLISRSSRRGHIPDWFDALLIIILAGLAGGRAGFVLAQWGYFQIRLAEAVQIWQGGLSYHGALLAGIAALLAWAALKKRSFNTYADVLAPAFVAVIVFGWTACLFEGCAYGKEGLIGPFSADLPDEFGVFAIRYQTQMAGILLTLTAFVFIFWYQNKRSPGMIFWSALAAVSLIQLFIDPFRGDPTITIGPLRLGTILNFLLVLISLLLLQYERRKGNAAKQHSGS